MDFYSKLLERVNQAGTFSTNSRIFVTRIEQGCAEGVLHADESSLNPNGIVHGGCLVTLADTVAGCAAHGLGGQYVTLSSNLNFLAPAQKGEVRCAAEVRKAGRTIVVCNVTITDAAGKPLACGSFTFFRVGELPN